MKSINQIHREAFDCIDSPESRIHAAVRRAIELTLLPNGNGTKIAEYVQAVLDTTGKTYRRDPRAAIRQIADAIERLPPPKPWLITMLFAPPNIDPVICGHGHGEYRHMDELDAVFFD